MVRKHQSTHESADAQDEASTLRPHKRQRIRRQSQGEGLTEGPKQEPRHIAKKVLQTNGKPSSLPQQIINQTPKTQFNDEDATNSSIQKRSKKITQSKPTNHKGNGVSLPRHDVNRVKGQRRKSKEKQGRNDALKAVSRRLSRKDLPARESPSEGSGAKLTKKTLPTDSPETAWTISQTLGGHLIHADPIITKDELHLILAYPSAINIYATKKSSLIRSIPVANSSVTGACITAYALSAAHPTNLYVATSQGVIHLFHWGEGNKLGRWKLSGQVWALVVSTQSSSEGAQDIVYAIEQSGGKWRLAVHRLRSGSDAPETESKTIYSSSHQITQFRLVRDGQLVVATSGRRIIIGKLCNDSSPSLKSVKYLWRELVTTNSITTLDVRDPLGKPTSMQRVRIESNPGESHEVVIDVLVGHDKGVLNIYPDLLNKLVALEHKNPDEIVKAIAPRRMHWHREAVLSAKWSADGNYVISGGSETVLFFWQLDTDAQNFLPHLSAAINSIVVAPKGAAYVIRLSDNSTMILSSSELKPKTYVGGIQAIPWRRRMVPLPPNRSKRGSSAQGDPRDPRVVMVPATISRLNPSQLLLAVPSTSSSYAFASALSGSPYLQAIDLATAHHISRQALTRTNVTNANIDPDLNKLVEPSVTFVQASHDGRWLATVDEWSPPLRDIEGLVINDAELWSECHRRTEIFLKFWSWNAEHKQWELVTRVNRPHSLVDDETRAGRVLDLQADPKTLSFSTVGEDGVIRIWKAKVQLSNNLVVRTPNGEPLMEWSCRCVIPLGRPERLRNFDRDNLKNRRKTAAARLAYSSDGTVLAASQAGTDDGTLGLMHFIEPNSGDIRRTQAGLYSGVIAALGFVERHLVTVAEDLMVWDTVQGCLTYGFSLQSRALSQANMAAMIHLAVDHTQGSFAVALPIVEVGDQETLPRHWLRGARSQILVFDPKQPAPLHATALPNLVTALVPLVGSKGYAALDSAAELRIISHTASLAFSLSEEKALRGGALVVRGDDSSKEQRQDEDEDDVDDGGRDGVGHYRDVLEKVQQRAIMKNNDDGDDDDDDDDDDAAPVVRQEQLTEIFDVGPAYSLPRLEELFGQVAGLFSKKPLVSSSSSSSSRREEMTTTTTTTTAAAV